MPGRRALAFIFCTASLDALALGIMIPILPKIILEFEAGNTANAAGVFGLFATGWGLMQFLFSPPLGALSDRCGRRPVILISSLGLGLSYVLMALAPSLGLLLVGQIISGITSATIATSFAYIADVSAPEERAKSFGVVGLAFGLGFVLGPALGGLLAGIELRLPFWVSAAACLANAAFGWFVLPESLPPERRMAFSWKRANPVGALNLLLSQRALIRLAAIHFIVNLAHQVLLSVGVLYLGYRYGWDETKVGLSFALFGVCSALVQGLAVGPVVKWLGTRLAIIAGLLAGSLGMAIFALAPTGLWFVVGVPVVALSGVVGPSVQDTMSRQVSASEQGQLQGAISSSRSITGLIGPAIFSASFAYLLAWLPGAPFLLSGLLLLAAAGLTWFVTAPPEAGIRPSSADRPASPISADC
jgi:MFS transporter, DHA1 family, tetracycline resistance protein